MSDVSPLRQTPRHNRNITIYTYAEFLTA